MAKNSVIHARVTVKEQLLLKDLADSMGISVSELIHTIIRYFIMGYATGKLGKPMKEVEKAFERQFKVRLKQRK